MNTSHIRSAATMDSPRVPAADAPEHPTTAQMLALSEFEHSPLADAPPVIEESRIRNTASSSPLRHVKTVLTVCVGCAELTVGELLGAKEQQVLRLDRSVDQTVDILLGGEVIARGTLVAVDDCFGVRITELPRSLVP